MFPFGGGVKCAQCSKPSFGDTRLLWLEQCICADKNWLRTRPHEPLCSACNEKYLRHKKATDAKASAVAKTIASGVVSAGASTPTDKPCDPITQRAPFWRKESLQQHKRDEYEAAGGGGTGKEVHAAHKISCEEMAELYGDRPLEECRKIRDAYWALDTDNYRMVSASTNYPVHHEIDKMLIKHYKTGAPVAPFAIDYADGTSFLVPITEILGRIQQKIDVAKDMNDARMLDYLKSVAISANKNIKPGQKQKPIDLRVFNGTAKLGVEPADPVLGHAGGPGLPCGEHQVVSATTSIGTVHTTVHGGHAYAFAAPAGDGDGGLHGNTTFYDDNGNTWS